MSTSANDNAFPVHSIDFFDEKPIGTTTHHGLSKREYFAAIALQGLLANPENKEGLRALAGVAVATADNLIERLSKSIDS